MKNAETEINCIFSVLNQYDAMKTGICLLLILLFVVVQARSQEKTNEQSVVRVMTFNILNTIFKPFLREERPPTAVL